MSGPRLSTKSVNNSDGPMPLILKDYIDFKILPAVQLPALNPDKAAAEVSAWGKQPATSSKGRSLPVGLHSLIDE